MAKGGEKGSLMVFEENSVRVKLGGELQWKNNLEGTRELANDWKKRKGLGSFVLIEGGSD